jgi:hypothetical protein
LAFVNPSAIVIHRVNECDERKGEAFINHKLVRANYVADATVFVGSWLAELPIWRQYLRSPWFVVRNGSDQGIFNNKNFRPWSGNGPIRLVTHHWGYHPLKGFDIYSALDRMLAEPRWKDRIAFTYVGNLPPGFKFTNTCYLAPMDGQPLAAELSSHHAYVTGSVNEPGGNHQNEGALCGLPLLYRKSGCMPEYCDGFGISFSGQDDFSTSLEQLMKRYGDFVDRMAAYPHTAQRMTREWLSLFEALLSERDRLVKMRKLWRNPLTAFANQLPF